MKRHLLEVGIACVLLVVVSVSFAQTVVPIKNSVLCSRQEPLDVVARLEASWVTMQEVAPVSGYACLVSQLHAVELHDLPEVFLLTQGLEKQLPAVSRRLPELI